MLRDGSSRWSTSATSGGICWWWWLGRGPDALFPSEDVFERQLVVRNLVWTARRDRCPQSTRRTTKRVAFPDLVSVRELAWAFKRCASRLAEMALLIGPRSVGASGKHGGLSASNIH